MRTEGIAGEERLDFRAVGVHCIRPVQERKHHEFQGLVAEGKRIIFLHGDAVEVMVDDMLKEGNRRAGSDYGHSGIDFQKLLHRPGMIRFRVVHDQIIDIRDFRNRFNVFFHIIPEGKLRRLEHRRLLAALQDIRIIGSAVFRFHDDIKNFKVRIQNAGPVKIFLKLKCFFHSLTSLYA